MTWIKPRGGKSRGASGYGSSSGTSSGYVTESSSSSSSGSEECKKIKHIVDAFLNKHKNLLQTRECENNNSGELLNLTLGKIRDRSGRPIIFSQDYVYFLDHYGFLQGEGFNVYSFANGSDKKELTRREPLEMAARQRGFRNLHEDNKNIKNVENCWLIAEIDEDKQYYIDMSKDRKIFSIGNDHSDNAKPSFVANNFYGFLAHFVEEFDVRL